MLQPEKKHAQKRDIVPLPYELYAMILSFLSVDQLIPRARNLVEARQASAGKSSKGITVSAGASPATKVVAEDTLMNAWTDMLLAKLNDRPLRPGLLKDLNDCHLILQRVKRLWLNPLDTRHVFWLRAIHRLNPNITWDIVVDDGNLELVRDLKNLEGLAGTLDIAVESQDDLSELSEICARSRTNLKLKLRISPYGDVKIEHLLNRNPILERLVRLTARAKTENELRSLDRICAANRLDTALSVGACCGVLRSCKYVPSTLVRLKVRFPTKDDLLWIEGIGRHHALELTIRNAHNVRLVSECVPSRRTLTLLRADSPLNNAADVLLFKQLCKAHPNMEFEVELSHGGLLGLLLDNLPMGLNVFHRSGQTICCRAEYQRTLDDDDDGLVSLRWQPRTILQRDLRLSCDQDCFKYLLNADLSRLRQVNLFLTDDAELDCRVINAMFAKCVNLEYLLIDTDKRSADLGEFPGILARALDQYWPKLNRFTIGNSDGRFFHIDLPNFVSETDEYSQDWYRR